MKKKLRLSFNAPAVLTFTALCVIVQLISMLTRGESNRVLFSVYRASLLDPLTWVRCFTHVLGHAGWEHLLGNIMYILILGPMIEEKYGTATTAFIMAATALVIGVINMVFFPGVMLLGASGIVFAFILIASITIREYGIVTTGRGTAGDCVSCGQCERACPQGLPVITLLRKCKAELEK